MVRLLGLISFVISILHWSDVYGANAYATNNYNTEVRVRLASHAQLELVGVGLRSNFDSPYMPVALPSKITMQVSRRQGVWQITKNSPLGTKSYQYSGDKLSVQALELKSSGQYLPKHLHLIAKSEELFDVVGVMGIEEYILGVVGAEMPASWPIEALKAQAVAARTYAYRIIQDKSSSDYHLESSTLDQVFKHSKLLPAEFLAKVKEAVESTEGLILTDPLGKPIKTFYHSDCGGQTALAKTVWGVQSQSVVVVDQSCPAHPKARWSYEIKDDNLKSLLASSIKDVLEIQPQYIQGRVKSIKIINKLGEQIEIAGEKLRALVGYNLLKSTQFQIEKNEGTWVFVGRGHGHGVGMCQYGAKAQAQQGKSYREILKRYYGAQTDLSDIRRIQSIVGL